MHKKSFTFERQYLVGLQGVEWFLKRHPHYERNDLKDYKAVDLIDTRTGETLELKTDTYTTSKNFYLEHHSHYTKGGAEVLGGLWKAKEKGAAFFAYLFINLNQLYVMRTDDAYDRMLSVLDKYPKRYVSNGDHVSTGYAIPIAEFEDIFISPENV